MSKAVTICAGREDGAAITLSGFVCGAAISKLFRGKNRERAARTSRLFRGYAITKTNSVETPEGASLGACQGSLPLGVLYISLTDQGRSAWENWELPLTVDL